MRYMLTVLTLLVMVQPAFALETTASANLTQTTASVNLGSGSGSAGGSVGQSPQAGVPLAVTNSQTITLGQ